jgi:hypothetical protein
VISNTFNPNIIGDVPLIIFAHCQFHLSLLEVWKDVFNDVEQLRPPASPSAHVFHEPFSAKTLRDGYQLPHRSVDLVRYLQECALTVSIGEKIHHRAYCHCAILTAQRRVQASLAELRLATDRRAWNEIGLDALQALDQHRVGTIKALRRNQTQIVERSVVFGIAAIFRPRDRSHRQVDAGTAVLTLVTPSFQILVSLKTRVHVTEDVQSDTVS